MVSQERPIGEGETAVRARPSFAAVVAAAGALTLATFAGIYLYNAAYPGEATGIQVFLEDFQDDEIALRRDERGDFKLPLHVPQFRHRAIGDDSILTLSGFQMLFGKDFIEVSTDRTYRMSVRLRVLPDSNGQPVQALTYAGFATFDAQKNLQESGPGLHRYAVLRAADVSSDDDWQVYEGTITGEGDETHHQFRQGTAFIKPALLLNYRQGTDVSTEIDYLVVSEESSP